MLDEYLWGAASRISPEAPVAVVEVVRESAELGGAANVAQNISSLKGLPILAGVVGRDSAGERLKRILEEKGIATDGVFVEEDRPTTVKTRIMAQHQHILRVDKESKSPISDETKRKVVEFVSEGLENADALLFEDYDKGVLDGGIIGELVGLAKSQGKVVTADPKFDHFFEYRGVDLFKPNQREVEAVMGVRLTNGQSASRVGRQLVSKLGDPSVLLTQGEKGMVLFLPEGEETHIAAVAREVFDVSGAGDTVIAAATLALAAGASPREAAVIANSAAGIGVSRVGVVPVDFEELWEAI